MSSKSEIEQIIEVIYSGDFEGNQAKILAWLSDPKLSTFFFNRFPRKFADLSKIRFLLDFILSKERVNPLPFLSLLKENISLTNNQIILEYLKTLQESNKNNTLGDEFIVRESIDMITAMLQENPEQIDIFYGFINSFIISKSSELKDYDSTLRYEREIIGHLLKSFYDVYLKNRNNEKSEDIVSLILASFDLIHDDSDMVMYTPNGVFEILKRYCLNNFKTNSQVITSAIINQYSEYYERAFEGWELIGGGISQHGDYYSITDNHFVSLTLKPAVEWFYSQQEKGEVGWQWLLQNWISTADEAVSEKKPDFLNRSCIDIILDRYFELKGESQKEAFQILENFILSKHGIPHKRDIIFQSVRGRIESAKNSELVWSLIEVGLHANWNTNKLPLNIFFEQIVSILASDRYQPALQLQEDWVKSKEYVEASVHVGGTFTISNFKRLITSESEDLRKEGIKLFSEYITQEGFKTKLDRFDAYGIAEAFGIIFSKDFQVAQQIFALVYQEPKLTTNQQILLLSGLNHIDDRQILFKSIKKILFPLLADLQNDINHIVKRFDNHHVRSAIPEIADKLAKSKYFDEALFLIDLFSNDPAPSIENDPDDPKGQFNYHQKIAGGEVDHSITTPRGWTCWALHEFCVTESRAYIPKALSITEKLLHDSNYYVRYEAIVPLIEFARIRNTVLPENRTEFFLTRETSEKIKRLAFEMIRNEENQKLPAIMQHMARVFNYLRSLTTEEAAEGLAIFLKHQLPGVVENIAPSFVFYAEYRQDAFSGHLWKDLPPYDPEPVRAIFINKLKSGNEEARGDFAFQLFSLIREVKDEKGDFDKAFDIAVKYFNVLAQRYTPEAFNRAYSFIEEVIDKKYDESYKLYLRLLGTQKDAVIKNPDILQGVRAFPFYYHEKVLEKISAKDKREDFLSVISIMVSFPIHTISYHDLDTVVGYLKSYPNNNEVVRDIFVKLVEHDPNFYDDQLEWLGQIQSKVQK